MEQFWCWLGDNSDALQTIFIVLGTIAAFVVIMHNGLISRREATIQMVNSQLGAERDEYTQFKNLMREIEESKGDIGDYAETAFDNSDAQDIILRQINRYELISLGISQSVFNEKFYKRWFFSQVMRDYEKLTPFITRTRQIYKNEAYFCEFESLAGRWDRKRHPVKHPPRWKIVWWIVKGDFSRAKKALKA